MTLSEFFTKHFVLTLREKEAKKSTIAEYQTTVDYWSRFLPHIMVEQITKEHILHFNESLKMQPGRRSEVMSQNTRRKHMKNLRAILRLAGPEDEGNEEGIGLLERVPRVRVPEEIKRNAADYFRFEDLQAVFRVAHLAQRPQMDNVDPGLWWHAILQVFYYTTARLGAVMAARWGWINFERKTLTVHKSDYPDERIKGKDQTHYLTDEAIEALRRLKPANARYEDRVFPWPNWPVSHKSMYHECYRLQTLAGIPKERQRPFHAIRKCTITMLFASDPGAAQKLAGHQSQMITEAYYAENEKVIRPALAKLPRLTNALQSTAPAALPDAPINHVESTFDPTGGVILVYR